MTGGVSEVMYQITEIPFWNLETTTDVSKLDNVNLKPEPNGVHRVSVLKAFTHLLYDANFPNKARPKRNETTRLAKSVLGTLPKKKGGVWPMTSV